MVSRRCLCSILLVQKRKRLCADNTEQSAWFFFSVNHERVGTGRFSSPTKSALLHPRPATNHMAGSHSRAEDGDQREERTEAGSLAVDGGAEWMSS